MKTTPRTGKTKTRSTRKPRRSRKRRSRKSKNVAGGIFIEVLGFVAMILLFVYARGVMEPETQTIAQPQTQTQSIPATKFNEPRLQPQTAAVATIPQRENANSVRSFRVRFGAR